MGILIKFVLPICLSFFIGLNWVSKTEVKPELQLVKQENSFKTKKSREIDFEQKAKNIINNESLENKGEKLIKMFLAYLGIRLENAQLKKLLKDAKPKKEACTSLKNQSNLDENENPNHKFVNRNQFSKPKPKSKQIDEVNFKNLKYGYHHFQHLAQKNILITQIP